MRFLTVVGARPQFIKAAPISRRIRERDEEFLLHTGQHYDSDMSEVFFQELGLPHPDRDIGAGSGSHAVQTAAMLSGIETTIRQWAPDWVIVYGDTNTTLAGALAAAKLNVPIAHIEAGLRSGRRDMPEEVNRIVVDHISELLFVPTSTGMKHLQREGLIDRAHLVGDVMVDTLYDALPKLSPARVKALGVEPPFSLATMHRPALVDDAEIFAAALVLLGEVPEPVLFAMHPRTQASLERLELSLPTNVVPTGPLSYLDTLSAARDAESVITDSGGLQKDAIVLGTKCISLRTETELPETVEEGWITVVGTDAQKFRKALASEPTGPIPEYLSPGASDRIVNMLRSRASSRQ